MYFDIGTGIVGGFGVFGYCFDDGCADEGVETGCAGDPGGAV